MVTRQELGENDERYVLGQWFESVAAAVKAYPMRAGTKAGTVLQYDRAVVSPLSRTFNAVAKSRDIPSGMEQAAAKSHVYKIDKTTTWSATDAKAIEAAAQDFKDGVEKVEGQSFASRYMLERMRQLYKLCKLNRIGVSVHSPEPGLIQIDLVPQDRPISRPLLRPPAMTFGK